MFQKTYVINCDVCDTRKMKEEDYSKYEKIIINADLVLMTERSKSILNRLPVTINADSFLELDEDKVFELKTINGSYEISPDTSIRENTILTVNGSLFVHQGSGDALKNLERVVVNGSAKCPKSLEAEVGKWCVNGSLTLYPEDCVMLKRHFEMDVYFPLRVRQDAKYYAEREIVITNPKIEVQKLVDKNVQFVTKRLVVCEELVEACAQMFAEDVEFVVIPTGTKFVQEEVELTKALVEESGGKLFVNNDITIPADCDFSYMKEQLVQLHVNGKVKLFKNQEVAFRSLNTEYEKLEFLWEGRLMMNQVKVKVDNTILENSPNKLKICNAAIVTIAKEVTPETIIEKLVLENCAKVLCEEEQKSAVSVIAKNVASIGEDIGIGSLKDLLGAKVVNADEHVM